MYIGHTGVEDDAAIVTASHCKTKRICGECDVEKRVSSPALVAATDVFAHDVGWFPSSSVGIDDPHAQPGVGVESGRKEEFSYVLRGEGPRGFETQASSDAIARPKGT